MVISLLALAEFLFLCATDQYLENIEPGAVLGLFLTWVVLLLASLWFFTLCMKAALWAAQRGAKITRSYIGVICFTWIPALPGVAVLVNRWHYPESWLTRDAIAFGYSIGVFWVWVSVTTILLSRVYAVLRRLNVQYNPSLSFVYYLFRASLVVKQTPNLPWIPLPNKDGGENSFLDYINLAASVLEAFPRVYRRLPRATGGWCDDAFRQRAAAVRGLERWFLLPMADTRAQREKRLKDLMNLAAVGDWNGLPQETPDTQATALSAWRKALQIARSLLTCMVPPAAIYALKNRGYLPEGQIGTYIITAAWVWGIVNFLALLDPRFGEKLSGFKDLSQFSGFSKGKEP